MLHSPRNEQRIEQLGSDPLLNDLEPLKRVKSREQLAETMGASFKGFGSSLFNLNISYDDNNPTHYSVHVGQGGLGLPNRDYYLEPKFANLRQAYESYIAELLRLAAWPNAQSQARSIVALETQIAEASWTHAEERDPVKSYNPLVRPVSLIFRASSLQPTQAYPSSHISSWQRRWRR
jgi:putative endopeptidase